MKKWKKYESYLLSGDWHIHTIYTDGKDNVFDYCAQAEKNGLKLIAFTEHVRKELTYNFDDFVSDVFSAKDKFNLEILVGCEAKVLDISGTLDVSKKILKECEIVLGTFHKFEPPLKDAYLAALTNMITNPDVDIWAHPTLYAIRNGFSLSEEDIYEISNSCFNNEVLIEINIKYNVPNIKFQAIASHMKCKFVKGSDAHQISELLKITKRKS